MKLCNRLLWTSAVLVFIACSSKEPATTSPESSSQKTETKSTFQLRHYTAEKWDNGLQVVYIENHNLPSLSFGLLVKGGASRDPMTKSGLANLVAHVMVRGTLKMSANQIADGLGQLGSEFERDVSEDFSWFQVSGLSTSQEGLLGIFSDVLMHPRFDNSELEKEKKLVLASIKQRFDHPDRFVGEAFQSYLFGGHPYARPVSGIERDIKSIKREDLIRGYTKFVRPNNAVLVVTGDFSADISNTLHERFKGWEKRELESYSSSEPPSISGINIRLIDKPDLTQSQIVIGQMGIKRNEPDYLVLRIANNILGGNFSSRLMDRVRVNLGLTYGISSSFDARLDRGPFTISTFTKNQTVGTTINESLGVLRKFYEEGVTSEEVKAAKNYLMGTFPRAIETPERLGYNLALLRLYGISDDYLKDFISNVNMVSADQVNAVIKKHFNAKDLKITVLSKSADSLEQLRPLGLLEVKSFNQVF